MILTIEVVHPDTSEVYTVTGIYYPGYTGRMYLRNGDPGYPAEPAQFEFRDIKDEDGRTPLDDLWPDLIGELEENAIIEAEEKLTAEMEARGDYEYERRKDRD